MASFQYTARDKKGRSTTGTMEASSKQDLMDKLRGKGLMPTSVADGTVWSARAHLAQERHRRAGGRARRRGWAQ